MSEHVVHVISGLGGGGAEHMLERVLGALPPRFRASVVSLTGDGPVGERIRARGIPTHLIGMRPGPGAPLALLRLWRCLAAQAPSVLQTWLTHADLAGGGIGHYLLGVPVIWGVHQAERADAATPWTTRLVQAMCRRLAARVPARIVACSGSALAARVAEGYPAGRCVLIANGVDPAVFAPSAGARAALRSALGIASASPLVGLVARWHPDKDHANFCAAAGRILAVRPDTEFVLAGSDVTPQNAGLGALIAACGRPQAFHLLGYRDDLAQVYPALDLCVLSSRTEALPNSVLESMACAVPVVATAVGDVAEVIGMSGRVVAPRDPAALAAAVLELLAEAPAAHAARAQAARARILAAYTLQAAAMRYAALYDEVLAEVRRA